MRHLCGPTSPACPTAWAHSLSSSTLPSAMVWPALLTSSMTTCTDHTCACGARKMDGGQRLGGHVKATRVPRMTRGTVVRWASHGGGRNGRREGGQASRGGPWRAAQAMCACGARKKDGGGGLGEVVGGSSKSWRTQEGRDTGRAGQMGSACGQMGCACGARKRGSGGGSGRRIKGERQGVQASRGGPWQGTPP
jgi:hypothetical protein